MRDGRTIGVITSLVSGPYFGAVLTGVAKQASASGLRVVVFQTLDAAGGDEHPGVPESVEHVAWERVSGVVVVVAAVPTGYLAALQAVGRPIVLVSHHAAGLDLPSVAPDNGAGVREAVRHLQEHGHRRIAFAGHPVQVDLVARYQGYRDALRELGLEPDPALFFETGSSTRDGGQRAAALMIEAGLPCTAVVAGNDLNALGIISTLRAAGYRVPEDVAVVGFDDAPEAEHQDPPLSTVTHPIQSVGAHAVRLVQRMLAGDAVAPGVHPVDTTLVVRRSCGCPVGGKAGTAAVRPDPARDESLTAAVAVLMIAGPVRWSGAR